MFDKYKLRGFDYYVSLFGEPEWCTPELWLLQMHDAKREEDKRLFQASGHFIIIEKGKVVCVLI